MMEASALTKVFQLSLSTTIYLKGLHICLYTNKGCRYSIEIYSKVPQKVENFLKIKRVLPDFRQTKFKRTFRQSYPWFDPG